MPDLIGSVVSLTGYRDRDLLDATIVSVLADWLDPVGLRMYRCVGDLKAPRLLLQAGMRRNAPVVAGDPPWTPIESLPALADWPCHQQAVERNEPVLACRSRANPTHAEGVISVFPLWIGQQRFGLIEVCSEGALTEQQQKLVGGVLMIYRNQLGLLDYSERDTLTGLLNRRTFDEQFGKCLGNTGAPLSLTVGSGAEERREAHGTGRYWLAVMDIDHFKRVNDNFGHLIGDEVLLLVARILRGAFRHGDRLYRFGGEEFVVLLHADTRERATMCFERLRQQMEAFRFPQVGTITASIGFTELRTVDTASGAFERADRAVYHAKEHGRNQVHCHEQLVEAGHFESEERVGEMELF
jgi:diguanylate cyclase (GGDEF)-like protein